MYDDAVAIDEALNCNWVLREKSITLHGLGVVSVLHSFSIRSSNRLQANRQATRGIKISWTIFQFLTKVVADYVFRPYKKKNENVIQLLLLFDWWFQCECHQIHSAVRLLHTSQIRIMVYDGPTFCMCFERNNFDKFSTISTNILFLPFDWDWLCKNCVWHWYLIILESLQGEWQWATQKQKS